MKTTLIITAGLALATGSAALAQTPPPATDRSGGPTATAGSSAQSNAPASSTSGSAVNKPVHHKTSHKSKPAGNASTTPLPNGTGGSATPSGR